jgi:hypothetical protein
VWFGGRYLVEAMVAGCSLPLEPLLAIAIRSR